ncbi:MAG: TIGR04211 family SH3 domain-containing protein [Gammaproteobacteria bacterium]|nr:TIGR04211 family SH3 domain-containing protein [Gammaproteobacteria bacterium]
MKNCFNILVLLFIFNTSSFAQEFAYVTDSLQLRVYSNASADSDVLQTIDSGDSVEVFATQGGFSQVTTYDGTVGWVKSAFLVEEPPAKLLYYSVSEKNKELETEIDTLKNGVQDIATVIGNESETNKISELQTALAKEQEINQKLQKQIANSGSTQTIKVANISSHAQVGGSKIRLYYENKIWILIGLPLGLIIAGFLLGIKLSSWRMKKRLHGFSLK